VQQPVQQQQEEEDETTTRGPKSGTFVPAQPRRDGKVVPRRPPLSRGPAGRQDRRRRRSTPAARSSGNKSSCGGCPRSRWCVMCLWDCCCFVAFPLFCGLRIADRGLRGISVSDPSLTSFVPLRLFSFSVRITHVFGMDMRAGADARQLCLPPETGAPGSEW
jgi:hypothetical protein